jgi:glycerophosphoryl diester phosphodiesterase
MFSWLNPKRLPVVVAHRGASSIAPENTIASFEQAIADGADALELDVRLTSDEEVVVIHDDTVNRTTDGKGLVGNFALAEIRALSAGRWFHRRFAGERIPTFNEVLKLGGTALGINVELKSKPTRPSDNAIVDRCYELIRRHNAGSRVLVSSFHHEYLRYLRKLDGEIATGLLYHPARHRFRSPVTLGRALGTQYLVLSGASLRIAHVALALKHGLRIGEYTINTPQRLKHALASGVQAIYTDRPRRIIALLSDR